MKRVFGVVFFAIFSTGCSTPTPAPSYGRQTPVYAPPPPLLSARLQDTGHTDQRAYFGIAVTTCVSEKAEMTPYVSYVTSNSPAQTAGIELLDRVISVAGISVQNGQDVAQIAATFPPSNAASFVIKRNGKVEEKIVITVPFKPKPKKNDCTKSLKADQIFCKALGLRYAYDSNC